MELKRDM